MAYSRRMLLGVSATASGLAAASRLAMAGERKAVSEDAIGRLFAHLPGQKAFKVFAPAVSGKPEFLAASNASGELFIGSAVKAFILCEALREADGPDVVDTISKRQLALDASVWSLDSQTFNPPELSGLVSERTALEAMIMHSDNTATDMSLKLVGPGNVRSFIAGAGLERTKIPDSTRALFGYLLGAPDYKTYTWDELVGALRADRPIVNSPLNKQETMASSADDLVSFYARALQGAFFKHAETLTELRRILSIGGAIWLVPLPLGVSAFVKGGSIDVPGFHCVSIPGGMFFSDRWVYFAFIINWNAAGETDATTVGAFVGAVREALALVKEGLAA